MPTGKRLNIYFTDEDDLQLFEKLEEFAKSEKRSLSQMMKILAAEAIAKRTKEDK